MRANKKRCAWPGSDELYVKYHDEEWGVPLHNDQKLFEFLILEGAQAGLSWITILRRRDHYHRAFDGFDPVKVAGYDKRKIARLLKDPGIIRNRLKVESTVKNAQSLLAVVEEFETFDKFIWRFVSERPIQNRWKNLKEIPAETEESQTMSKELRRRGFSFVGPTICYAHMQATGMVNDHVQECFRYRQVKGLEKGRGSRKTTRRQK